MNPLIHPHPIRVKKIGGLKNTWIHVDGGYKLVPEGLGNCSFDLPAELCFDKSATKRNLSLTFTIKVMCLKTETVEPGLIRKGKGHAIVFVLSACPYQAGCQKKRHNTCLSI